MFRKHVLRLCLVLSSLGFFVQSSPPLLAAQQMLYVATSGNDENPGTRAKPFASINAARRAVRQLNADMKDDIIVMISGGTYRVGKTLRFDAHDSGTGGHSVIYRAEPGQQVVLSGGKLIQGWQPDAAGRWKAKTDLDNFRQLYVNGVRAVRARSPALPPAKPIAVDEIEFPSMAGFELFGADGYKTEAVDMAKWKRPSEIEFCYYSAWTNTRCKVESIKRDGDVAIVTMSQPHFMYAREKEGAHVDLPSYIENALELLDEPGEWYLDRSNKTVYYIPRPGEDLSKLQVIAPLVESLIELHGELDAPVENIQFEGITFAEAGWLRPSETGLVDAQANFVIDWKNPMKRSFGYLAKHNEFDKSPANVVCHTSKSLRFERCTFTRLGGAGIDVECGSQDNVISGCKFYDISGSAIQIGGVLTDDHHPDDERKINKNNVVTNNYIHDCCVEYMGGLGVFAGYTDGTVIAHNEICRLPYSSISVGWGWGEEDAGGGDPQFFMPSKYSTPTPSRNNRIENNHLHHLMTKLGDGGGVYTLGNMAGTIIRGNYIHDNKNYFGGIYLDMGSGFIEVTGNVVNNVVKPMFYNNLSQDRNKTCNEHDNWFDCEHDGRPEIQAVIEAAGLEPQYRDLKDE